MDELPKEFAPDPVSNEIACDRYLGRLVRLHPEHMPGGPRATPRVTGEPVPVVVYVPTPRTIDHVLGGKQLTIQHIIDAVADFHDLTTKQILGHGRRAEVIRGRHMAFYLCHKLTGLTQAEIGRRLHRDHTTILHAVRRVERMLAQSARAQDELHVLKLRLIDHVDDKPRVAA